MKNRWRFLTLLGVLTAFLVLGVISCGGGGGGGQPPAGSSNWDTMVWDKDDWA